MTEPGGPGSTSAITPCGETDLGSAGVLRSRLVQRAAELCIPIAVSMELTRRCNLRCLHCYNCDRTESETPSAADELTADEIRWIHEFVPQLILRVAEIESGGLEDPPVITMADLPQG